MQDFIEQINSYYPLSAETTDALLGISKEDCFKKNELLQNLEKQPAIIIL